WLIFATSPKGEAFETFPASPSGEVPSVSEAEGFLFLCNFQICSFIVQMSKSPLNGTETCVKQQNL
ncbi:MAG: hypothetical protein II735_06575, partial [Clostridia bacterium]|nr:hypothetical protein [Clostridia bacterium]